MSTTIAQDPVLTRLRAGLEEVYGDKLARLVLFGSRARGDHREDSDYDVAVFLHDPDSLWTELGRISQVSAAIIMDMGAFVSAKAFPAEDYDNNRSFMQNVRKDGIDL